MKRLFFASLVLLILLLSCSSVGNYMVRAEESDDVDERISIYSDTIRGGNQDMRAYYNLAYLYLYKEDYQNAEAVLKEAISLFPETFRFYSALLYLYEETGAEDAELELSYDILSFMHADEDIRNRILRILDKRDDPRAYDFAKETIVYYPENQRAINILSDYHPFFLSHATVNLTEEDILEYRLPLSERAFSILINPDNYNESVLESLNGTLLSQAE